MENNMVKIGGLWRQESSKDGSVFYSGALSYSSNILIFKNKFKKNERDPDLILYVSKREQKERQEDQEDQEAPEDSGIPF